MASRDWAGALNSPITANSTTTPTVPPGRSVTLPILTLIVLLCSAPETVANELDGVRIHDAPDSTRVVLSTADAASYKLFRLDNPERVVIDLFDTRAASGFSLPATDSRVVKGIRAASRRGTGYRVVLDLDGGAELRELVLAPIAPYRHRLVIDIYPAERPVKPSVEVTVPARDRDVIVAVDPGHGGEDPGAIGVGRVIEKRVVLAISREVAKNLDAMPGIRAVLIRTGDYYVPLRRRFEIADRSHADMFISIHADAFRKSGVSGASVYMLSERGASSETAKLLAERENRSDLVGGFGPVSLDDVDESVARIVVDLSMDSKRIASVELGEAVLGSMAQTAKLHKKRLGEAAFQVLKSPSLPSILIEAGFLSNPGEARRLAEVGHQRRLARAIANGIRDYAHMKPPDGTLLATMNEAGSLRYVVKRGDTLSEIAQRYRTTARRLRMRNDIATDRILVGQVLVIPFGNASGS